MGGNRPSRSASVANYDGRQACRDVGPAEVARDPRPQAELDIETPECLLQVADSSLDFRDEDDSRARMEGNQVNAPAIAVVIEADLDSHDPAEIGYELRGLLLHRSMDSVDKAVELLAAPAKLHVELCTESGRNLIDVPEGHAR